MEQNMNRVGGITRLHRKENTRELRERVPEQCDTISVGLCAGRHDLPVTEYIFHNILDPMDFEGMRRTAYEFVTNHCSEKELIVYATGLTAALCAVVSMCQAYYVPLTVMHYDRDEGNYKPQRVLWF